MAYEILTGDGPYEATTKIEWIKAHLSGTPKDLTEIRSDIDPNIAKVLELLSDGVGGSGALALGRHAG